MIVIALFVQSMSDNKKKEKRRDLIYGRILNNSDMEADVIVWGVKDSYYFAVDEKNRKVRHICFRDNIPSSVYMEEKTVSYDDIISVELLEDNTMSFSRSLADTIGGGIIGGALAGGAGAVIGGLSGSQTGEKLVSTIYVKVRLRNIHEPAMLIKCFDAKTMSDGNPAKRTDGNCVQALDDAHKICDTISVILDGMRTTVKSEEKGMLPNNGDADSAASSSVDELERLVALKEKGLLTDEEFSRFKAQLLARLTK